MPVNSQIGELSITSLNSGSNGNCYYISNEEEAVLIDVGISCRELTKRLTRLDLSPDKIKAIFISHEHVDHIRGVKVVSEKYRLPVYITKETLKSSSLQLEQSLVKTFKADAVVKIGGLSVTAFSKIHDAADPCSFMVKGNGIKIAIITDIGIACKQVIGHFKQCHAAFLEANYDEDMLENGNYPIYLKNRIRDGNGHLSNNQALDLFKKYRPEHMSHLILSHLSKNNNSPELVYKVFKPHADQTQIIVASRYEETPVFHIGKNKQKPTKNKTLNAAKQLSLF
jgi:phosphoribosyl 1,2-cyclic phosphodiesterase